VKVRISLERKKLIALLAVGLVSGIAIAQVTRSLIINGKVASTDVRVINGRSYAPIADIAKALDLTVALRPDGSIEMSKQGGSGAIDAKLTGKMGDWLFDGGWRVKISKVYSSKEFKLVNPFFGATSYTAKEGKRLILVDYQLRNGNKKMRRFHFGDVSLAGDSGTSESVEQNDFPFSGGTAWRSKDILPGSEIKGTLIFSTSEEFKEKDLILTIASSAGYDDAVKPQEETVLRISLN